VGGAEVGVESVDEGGVPDQQGLPCCQQRRRGAR
jgi:hypothetical protein